MTVRADAARRAEVRALWAVLEPLHAVVYFDDAHAAAMRGLGLKGWWMGYFASRSAPLGPAPTAVVGAMFYPFAPRMVARALPDAWSYASPTAVLEARRAAVESSLEPLGAERVTALGDLLVPIAAAADCAGRPLAAAGQQLGPPPTPAGRLWWATTVLREHRGDGHVAALLTHGVGRLEALVLHCAATGGDPARLRAIRGWTEDEWRASAAALTDEGLLARSGTSATGSDGTGSAATGSETPGSAATSSAATGSGATGSGATGSGGTEPGGTGSGALTDAGRELVASVEETTDAAASAAWPSRTEGDLDTVHALGRELSDRMVGTVVPTVTPIGNPWPPPGLPG